MRKAMLRFAANNEGSTAIEYGLIVAGIALAVLVTVLAYSEELQITYDGIAAGIASISSL